MNHRMPLIVLALALGAVTRGADASMVEYIATLTGPNEEPPNASPGTGFAEITFDTTANTLRVQASFSGLLGTTTASHIHAPTATPNAGTAGVATTTPTFAGFPLGVTSGTFDSGLLDLTMASSYNPAFITANGGTTAGAEAALLASAAAGTAYLNIHSTFAPNGEIRGFLKPVPEPGSIVLMGSGILTAMAYAWRRKPLKTG
jgi:hypothetical protein